MQTGAAWILDFDLIAQGNSDQSLVGSFELNDIVAARPTPTTGIGSWQTNTATAEGPNAISGSAAVDSDAGDRTTRCHVHVLGIQRGERIRCVSTPPSNCWGRSMAGFKVGSSKVGSADTIGLAPTPVGFVSLLYLGVGGAGVETTASHATSGALASQAATIAGTSTHLTLHTSTGALSAQSATISGTAAHVHATSGALASQAATVAGTSTHLTLHTSTGALSSQAATVSGTAAHQHAATGALSAQASTVAGSSAHLTLHTSTGALVSGDATSTGSATHGAGHDTTGALSAGAATISGAAVHPHTTTGALAAAAAEIAGASVHSTGAVGFYSLMVMGVGGAGVGVDTTHPASGALSSDAASIAGTSVHLALHATSGALNADAAAIAGAATRTTIGQAISVWGRTTNHPGRGPFSTGRFYVQRAESYVFGANTHPTSGALSADASTVAGTAAHLTLHTTIGALSAQAAAIAGTATHLTLHATSGALASAAASIAGSAEHTADATHDTSGALSAQDATIAGTAAHLTLHATSGALAADSAAISGTAIHPHVASGALASDASTLAGTAERGDGTHDCTGALQAQDASMTGEASILALFSQVHGFEMGGDEPRPKRRNLVTILPDTPRKTITKRDVDHRVFEKAREQALKLISESALEHATNIRTQPVRYAAVRTALKPISKALGGWDWVTVYQRMYDDALREQIKAELAYLDQMNEEDEIIALLLENS